MSYLETPRITFAGRFLSDTPTMNNDPASFGTADPPGPGWNPYGSGAFDLLECVVTGGRRERAAPPLPTGSLTGLAVLTSPDQVAAKLVDLDPDWQVSSEIWGLTVRLAGPDGRTLLSGRYRPAAFRDLWPRGGAGGDAMLGATFTSVLEDLRYGPAARTVPLLAELRETSPERLSIGLNLYGFSARSGSAAFATGRLSGCIGPWRPGEPLSFVAGRRLDLGNLAPDLSFGRAVAVVTGNRLVLDLGNAFPFAAPPAVAGTVHPLAARIGVAVLPGEHVRTGDVLDDANVLHIGTADLLPALPPAGIVSFPLTPQTAAALEHRPLALLTPLPRGRRRVISRESRDGLYVRADDFVHRVEAGTSAAVTLHARRRGRPAGGLTIHLEPVRGSRSVLTVPESVQTGPDGTAIVTPAAGDPGNPRRGLDGIVETIAYSPRRTPGGDLDLYGSGLDPDLDVVIAHVRDAYTPPAQEHLEREVQRILAPYARHYPIMGEHLVDLADLDAVRRWRAAMLLALSREITDPNHMPVTRDLSDPKRATVLRWLRNLPPPMAAPHPGT
ncbi:hypothetical protein AB0I81_29315 [Nonomuraea sp. NPDC050404]|uniref:hypothetical protein n=1 Tax=Nonomuraea sp. NPDC050404 TaxID=3155783 RepID=UPI0033FA804F